MELVLTDEDIVSRILGLPMERIEYLKQEHGLVCDEQGFDEWFVDNARLVLDEKKREFNRVMRVPELTPSASGPAVSSNGADDN